MPHLDDGQIAEWIDAAERPRGDRSDGAVADHLRECTVCRERVEEARRVAERARAILGVAAPPGTEAPPFDEVLARAGRIAGSRRHPAAWRWLAWAATLVIAGGLGWYARGAELVTPTATDHAALPAPTGDSARLFAAAEPRQPEVAPGTVGGASPPPAAGRRTVNQTAPAREQPRQSGANAPVAAKAEAREAEAVADEALRDTSARPQGLGLAQIAPTAAAPAAPSPAGNVAGVAAASDAAVATPQLAITRDVAERLLGGPLATVPGLPVERIELLAPGRVVRVLQRLPSGAPLELHEWSAANSGSEAYAARAQPQLDRVRAAAPARTPGDTVTLDGVRVTVRAELPADSLRVLRRLIRR